MHGIGSCVSLSLSERRKGSVNNKGTYMGEMDKANCDAFVQGNTDDAHDEGQQEDRERSGRAVFSINVVWMFSRYILNHISPM